jgi:hypothetical protein
VAPPDPVRGYAAICDRVFHSGDVPGALPDGIWTGSLQPDYSQALTEAQSHEDGLAYVVVYVGDVLVGPV